MWKGCTFYFSRTTYIFTMCTNLAVIVWNKKIVIDDILLFSNHVPILLHHLYCILRTYLQNTILCPNLVSGMLFKPWVDFIGHYLTVYDDGLAQFKFKLIKYWLLSVNFLSLFFLIIICYVYDLYCTWLEANKFFLDIITHMS